MGGLCDGLVRVSDAVAGRGEWQLGLARVLPTRFLPGASRGSVVREGFQIKIRLAVGSGGQIKLGGQVTSGDSVPAWGPPTQT